MPLKTVVLSDIVLDKECGLDVICSRHKKGDGKTIFLSLGAFVVCSEHRIKFCLTKKDINKLRRY